MKPRNKYEQRVAEINATLFEDIAQTNVDLVKEACKKWDMRHYCYFTVHSNMREFMVRRLYRVYKFTDKSTDYFFFAEIMREFNDGERKTWFSKTRIALGCTYYDTFSFGSDIELKDAKSRNGSGYCLADCFELSVDSYPEDNTCSRVRCVEVNPEELAKVIKNNPVAENLYKNNDPLFGYLLWRPYAKQVCRAITLAKRHGFQFNEKTTAIWFDMVRSIIYCKKDWHNPVFIAPKDLMAMHNKFVDMEYRKREREREDKRRRQEAMRIQRQIEEAKSQLERDKTINEDYIKRRKKFYNMVLTDGLIECRVLRDVQAFADEGAAMNHCVFRCGYYKKAYSLILSARIDDKRIETVEVDLKTYKILQCYGKHDQFTMYHNRIKDLVENQMDIIKQYNHSRKQIKIAV